MTNCTLSYNIQSSESPGTDVPIIHNTWACDCDSTDTNNNNWEIRNFSWCVPLMNMSLSGTNRVQIFTENLGLTANTSFLTLISCWGYIGLHVEITSDLHLQLKAQTAEWLDSECLLVHSHAPTQRLENFSLVLSQQMAFSENVMKSSKKFQFHCMCSTK